MIQLNLIKSIQFTVITLQMSLHYTIRDALNKRHSKNGFISMGLAQILPQLLDFPTPANNTQRFKACAESLRNLLKSSVKRFSGNKK
jgi:hypothetical protein